MEVFKTSENADMPPQSPPWLRVCGSGLGSEMGGKKIGRSGTLKLFIVTTEGGIICEKFQIISSSVGKDLNFEREVIRN